MPQYGSSQNLISTNLSQTVDNQGNPIISSDTGFAASPLGYAARAQALFGLPNSTFELTPPDTTAVISQANPLPYWDVQDYSSGVMSGSAIYDSATNSWGVNLNPGTATTNDYITMTTRSYLINDSNLSLRQQALAVVSKVGTYAGTTQWNLELTAAYYDGTNTLLHSGTVATIYDNATWTSMAGTTTTGGTAISASAHYVDLQFKLTATAPVTSATSVTIKSCLLQTSSGAGGGAQSFLVTERFNSSDTWTRPTGVEYLVAVIGLSGGSGGEGGTASFSNTTVSAESSFGGNPGVYGFIRNVYVGDQTTISVGVGAGGNGGVGGTATKSGTAASVVTTAPTSASVGGATTFGSYLTCTTAASGTVGTVTSTVPFGDSVFTNAGSTNTATTFRANSYWQQNGFSSMPYQDAYPLAGGNGAAGQSSLGTTGTTSGTSIIAGGAVNNAGVRVLGGNGGSAGYIAGEGGRSGIIRVDNSGTFAYAGTTLASGTATSYSAGSAQAGAGGGGGAAAFGRLAVATNLYAKGGDGGNASANSGSGGGGGGPARCGGTATVSGSSGTAIGGNGGNGGAGFVIIAYVA